MVAGPRVPITDSGCPTMTVMYALADLGFIPVKNAVVHTASSALHLDVRNAVSKKPYDVCCVLERLNGN